MRQIRSVLIVLVASAALGACSTTPQQCDLRESVGACAVRVDFKRNEVVVCATEPPAQALPVCMSAAIDVTSGKGYSSRKLLLAPGQCRSLGTGVTSAAQASCSAFPVRAELARQ